MKKVQKHRRRKTAVGTRVSRKLVVETLDERALLAAYIDGLGDLVVDGTNGSDYVTVDMAGDGAFYRVSENGQKSDFPVSSVSGGHVYFHGNSGDDIFVNNVAQLSAFAFGGEGNDRLYGDANTDFLFGGPGDDYLNGWTGDDYVFGEEGDDHVFGHSGNDYLDGGDGADVMRGGDGSDMVFGGRGNDKLYGDAQFDWLYGEDGNDFLDDGSGNEFVDGGQGENFNAYVWAIGGAEANDVHQGNHPNCGALASIAAVSRRVDLEDRISYLGNGLYRVGLYNINGQFNYQYVTFDGDLDGWINSDPDQTTSGNCRESWVAIVQLALNQQKQANTALAPTSWHTYDDLQILTGANTDRHDRNPTEWNDLSNIWYALHRGQPVIASTSSQPGNTTVTLISGHYYTVTALYYDGVAHEWRVMLRNPWGTDGGTTFGDPNDGHINISWTDFGRWMTRFAISRIPS